MLGGLNIDFEARGKHYVSWTMWLHGGRRNWAWMVLGTSPTMQDDLKDRRREGVGEGACLQLVHEPKPVLDKEKAVEEEDTQTRSKRKLDSKGINVD